MNQVSRTKQQALQPRRAPRERPAATVVLLHTCRQHGSREAWARVCEGKGKLLASFCSLKHGGNDEAGRCSAHKVTDGLVAAVLP